MLLIQVLLIQVSTIIIFDNLYVQNQSTTTAQALARTKTRMTTWLNSNFRGRWKEVSGPNVTLASNQWMIVMRIGKQGGNYDYHYWYRTNDGPWANIWIFCAPGMLTNVPKWFSSRWQTAGWTGCEED